MLTGFSVELTINLSRASSSANGRSDQLGGITPRMTSSRLVGRCRLDEKYFTAVDMYMNWPEDLETRVWMTSPDGQDGGSVDRRGWILRISDILSQR